MSDAITPEHVRVKICGITTLEDALVAVGYGADELGFNFYDKSPRFIPFEEAGRIVKRLPNEVIKVGVFVNPSLGMLRTAIEIAGIDKVQLHGDEDDDLVTEIKERFGLPVIKAFRVGDSFDKRRALTCPADAILFDGYSAAERGGSGVTFDWVAMAETAAKIDILYAAGGINADNVAQAIETLRPNAVDACSGVESSPGKKDKAKLAAFMTAVGRKI